MLKVELHTHTADDPEDRISHTTRELIDRAAELDYDAVAITLHDRQLDLRPYLRYADDRGIVLIPGIERTIQGRHVLLINFRSASVNSIRSFEDLAHLKRREQGLVVAPHAFFPGFSCLRGMMDRHADLFDAVEYNAMFTESLNFNTRAAQWAEAHGKPIVGNGDVHRLVQLGSTYSLVDADRNPDAICAAIAAGAVTVVRRPLTWAVAGRIMASLYLGLLLPRESSRVMTRQPGSENAL